MNDELHQQETTFKKKGSYLTPILILLAVIYVGFLLYQAVYINYATNQKINKLRNDLKMAQEDKDRLELLINYYKTSTFQELEARKKLGLKMPGEIVVKVDVPKGMTTAESKQINLPNSDFKQSNPALWFDFMLGKEQN